MEKEQLKNDPLFHLLEILRVRKIKIIIGFLIVFAITVAGVFSIPGVYQASTTVSLSLPVVPKGGDVVPYLEELRDLRSFVNNQPVVASSRLIYEKAVIALNLHRREEAPSFLAKLKNVFSEKNPDRLAVATDSLYKITDVRLIKGTNIIQFTARSKSSEGAAQIANTLAKTYIDHVNGLMVSRAQMAYDIISGELESGSKSLNASQRALDALRRSMSVANDPVIVRTKLAGYSMEYDRIQERIQELESTPIVLPPPASPQRKEITQTRPERIYPVQPTESPKMKELKANLKNLRYELDVNLGRYTEKHPTVITLRKKIGALEEELLREEKAFRANQLIQPQPLTDTELDSPAEAVVGAEPDLNQLRRERAILLKELKAKKEYLSKQIQILESKLSKESLIAVELEKVNRDVIQKEIEYAAVKEKLEHARVLRDQTREGPLKIIDLASPPAHASMKKKIILLIVGLMASAIFGIAVGFIAEYYEDVFKSPEEVEQSLKLPVLATIPRIPEMIRKEKSRLRSGQKG